MQGDVNVATLSTLLVGVAERSADELTDELGGRPMHTPPRRVELKMEREGAGGRHCQCQLPPSSSRLRSWHSLTPWLATTNRQCYLDWYLIGSYRYEYSHPSIDGSGGEISQTTAEAI